MILSNESPPASVRKLMKGFISIIAMFVLVTGLNGQVSDTVLASLAFNADVMINASRSAHRERAEADFRKEFIMTLGQDGSFRQPFDSLVWIQQLVPSDSSFRIFTWHVETERREYSYGGVVQMRNGDLIQLHDKRRLSSEYATFDANTWYGALYYGIKPFTMATGQAAYLILGYNANNSRSNQKTCDVLTFDGQGQPVFGAEVFESVTDSGSQDVKSRIIIEYNDAASGRMQFDNERGYVVYDNVIVIDGGPEGPIFVPDGSFHAYELKDGKLTHIDKLFNVTVDEPPGDGIQREDRDLFGRKKNN